MTSRDELVDVRPVVSAHKITTVDGVVRGNLGTTATCSCGWRSAWAVRDGSAEADAHGHMYAHDPDYRAEQDKRYEAWQREQREKGCKCELIGGYASVRKRECIMHRPKNIYNQPLPPEAHHSHNCSCHISAPCGECENCRHWDHPECKNDCQECEEHAEYGRQL